MTIQSNIFHLYNSEISCKNTQTCFLLPRWQRALKQFSCVKDQALKFVLLFIYEHSALQSTSSSCISATCDPYGNWDCSGGRVPTHKVDFFLPNTRPHAGGQGVYISKSLKFGGEVIPRIKTVTDTLFLAIQGGNIKVHTLFFWKIKPSGWQTCLAEKSQFGIHAHSHAHCAEELELGFFHPFLILPDYVCDLKESNHKDTAPW